MLHHAQALELVSMYRVGQGMGGLARGAASPGPRWVKNDHMACE